MNKPRVYKEKPDNFFARGGKPWVSVGFSEGAVHWPTWDEAMRDAERLCQWQADGLI